jgi:fluoroquinolone transport system permease protein
MSRYLSILKWEIIRQYKNGIYFVSLFVLILWITLFIQIKTISLSSIVPMLILGNLSLTTFYFLAGILLFEKGEGSLEAQVTTPIRSWEYLSAKVLTLSVLATLENLIITIAFVGWRFNFLPVLLGTFLACCAFCLVGFLTVIRYDSINEFLLPSMGFMFLLSLPIVSGVWMPHAFFWHLHPIYGSYLWIESAFQSIESWKLSGSGIYLMLTIFFLGKWSLNEFNRYVVRSEGSKKTS